MSETPRLLPGGTEVRFADLGVALGRAGGVSPGGTRAFTATVVAVGPHARLVEAAEALDVQAARGGVRAILISLGDIPAPAVRVERHAVAIEGLEPGFIDNAVGALRLSSLPTLVWWRGGDADHLEPLADLADRLVLDEAEPVDAWTRAPRLVPRTALSDLRWTRLTRWRALFAHFFDIPEVRAAAGSFERLTVLAGDRHAARLFAGWLSSSLGWNGRVAIDIQVKRGAPALAGVTLAGGGQELDLALTPGGTCVRTSARVQGRYRATRAVALGDEGLAGLIAEELRIRTRDRAFEQALAAAEGIA